MLSAIVLPAFVGCAPSADITQERVTHEGREELRLRVAMLRDDDSVWFIRIDGPAALVEETRPAFDAFVKSSRFTKDKTKPLTWTEPKAWKKDPPAKERYATFWVNAKDKELEIKITKLPAKGFSMLPNL